VNGESRGAPRWTLRRRPVGRKDISADTSVPRLPGSSAASPVGTVELLENVHSSPTGLIFAPRA